jgi:hypothetical protein
LLEANIREIFARAFKEITQGQKNQATADAETANAAIDIMEKGMQMKGSKGSRRGN